MHGTQAKLLAGHKVGMPDHYVRRNPKMVENCCRAIERHFFAKPVQQAIGAAHCDGEKIGQPTMRVVEKNIVGQSIQSADHGTKSPPPGVNGWQRANRMTARQEPRSSPYFRSASMVY